MLEYEKHTHQTLFRKKSDLYTVVHANNTKRTFCVCIENIKRNIIDNIHQRPVDPDP